MNGNATDQSQKRTVENGGSNFFSNSYTGTGHVQHHRTDLQDGMSAKGVLVTSYDQSGKVISRSSAVSFGDLILLHGGHLIPLLEQSKWKELFKSILPSVLQNSAASTFIDDNLQFAVSEDESEINFLPDTIERVGRRVVTAGLWRCSLVEKSLEMFTFDDGRPRIVYIVHNLQMPERGRNVIVESTPGGLQAFINSWSRGTVARVYGRHDCMFLTDATVHSECIGAPVFYEFYSRLGAINKGPVMGIVLGKIGELNEFTSGIALLPVLRRIVPDVRIHPRMALQSSVRNLVDETVVLVSSGNLRGSGEVVDAGRGVILTCSHVIDNDTTTVKIHHMGNIFDADVVYISRECDLAVLKAPINSFTLHMDIGESAVQIGDSIYLAGFPHVLPFRDYDARPFVLLGCVSKLLPYVIIVNCSVSRGISGGAVIRDGKLLGLVSSMVTGQCGFAFAVPSTIFRDHIRKYIETDEVAYLKNLDSGDTNLIRFWNGDNSKL